MRIDYISDLHLDFWLSQMNMGKLTKEIGLGSGEVLIIAGDIGHYFNEDCLFLSYCKTLYNHVFVVPGNHDFYLISEEIRNKFSHNSMERVLKTKEYCDHNDIHFLDGNVVDVNGVKIGGLGMSWDTSFYEMKTGNVPQWETLEVLYKSMNDSRLIFDVDPLCYFRDQYEKLMAIDEVDVMVSHYGPVIPSDMRPEFRNSITTTFYYFDGRSEINRLNPKAWVFGHTHDSHDFMYGNTRMLCNPLGYPHENTYARIKSFVV